jgi:hypothetical protein
VPNDLRSLVNRKEKEEVSLCSRSAWGSKGAAVGCLDDPVRNQSGAWRPHWERMLAPLRGAVPAKWQVLVMAERGLDAAQPFETIQATGWHPVLRVQQRQSFRAQGEASRGSG